MNTHLEKYIKIYDIELDSNVFLECLNLEAQMSKAMTSAGDTAFRNCWEYYLHPGAYDMFTPGEKTLYDQFYKTTSKLVSDYTKEFDFASDSIVNSHAGFHILKYQDGGKYKQHVDDFGTKAFRRLSISLLLNDEYTGGEFSFFDDQYRINIKKNQAIVFPSTWMFPHQIQPVTSGSRWSIVSWHI